MDASTPGPDDTGPLAPDTAATSSRAPSPAPAAVEDIAMLSGTENDEPPAIPSTSSVVASATAPSGGLLPVNAPTSEGALSSRNKRVRTAVKFSPSKGPKAAGSKRMAALAAANNLANTSRSAAAAAQEDAAIPNQDFCSTCGGRGHFLCCDGCPRSFHFSCLDPPLELDEIPVSAWYCNVCGSERKMPLQPKGIFGPLILKVQCENPTAFELPKEIKAGFKGITTGSYGEYVDTDEFRPLSQLGKPGKNGYEERDPYKTRDKQGRTVLCARCHDPADPQKQKKIIACDFCELHWHLDCVDPPLVGLPAVTRRWKCPIHADSAMHGRKSLKNQKIVKVSKQRTQNNGDIDIIPSKRGAIKTLHVPEELISQGIRYQVPEQILILDFWSRVKRDKYGLPFERVNRDTTPAHNLFDFSDSSSLTSMEPSPERDLGPQPTARAVLAGPALDKGKGRADEADLPASEALDREDTAMSDGDPPDIEGWKAHMLQVGPPALNGHLEVEGQDGMQLDSADSEALARASSPDTRGAEQLFALSQARAASPLASPAPEAGLAEPVIKEEALSRVPSPAPPSQTLPATDSPVAVNGGRTLRARSKSPLPPSSPALEPLAAPNKPNSAGSTSSARGRPRKSRSPVPPPAEADSSASKAQVTGQVRDPPEITHTASSPVAARHPPAAAVERVSPPANQQVRTQNGADSDASGQQVNASRVDEDGDTSMS